MQFQTQITTLLHWLEQWNECTRTVAVITLLKKLGPVSAKFVSIALQQSLTNLPQLELQEQEANSPGFVTGLFNENKDLALTQLLTHVPLIHPNNTEVKKQYLSLLDRLLPHVSEQSSALEITQQLFTYIVIHPAFKQEKEKIFTFKKLLDTLEPCRSNQKVKVPSYYSESAPTGLNDLGFFDNIFINEVSTPTQPSSDPVRTKRSSSLTPPIIIPGSLSEEILAQGSRRLSLSDQLHSSSSLSTHSSLNSSSSESQLDDLKTEFLQKDVKAWLKYLRLHKYGPLFASLTYEQILSINENTFDSLIDPHVIVTQGAKRKIISSIRKLNDRYSVLCHLEQDVMVANLKTVKHVLNEIKTMIIAPMKLVPEEETLPTPPQSNIPAQIIKVLGKVYNQLFMIQASPEDYGELCATVELFISCCDSVLNLQSFNRHQKVTVHSWKTKITISISKTHKMHGYLFRPNLGNKSNRPSPSSPLTKSPTTPNASPSQTGPSFTSGKPQPPTEFEHLVRSVVELGME